MRYETIITKRKYNRDVLTAEQQWCFSGVGRGSSKYFIEVVENKKLKVLHYNYFFPNKGKY